MARRRGGGYRREERGREGTMVHAWCVSKAGIHLSRTGMSASLDFV